MPPTYNATRGFIARDRARDVVGEVHGGRRRGSRACRATRPERAAPFSSVARNSDALAGESPIGIQPSATSAGERDVRGPARGEVDRQRRGWGAGSSCSGLPSPVASAPAYGSVIARAVVRDRRLAPEDLAHDRDVVARAGDRLRPRLAVPALDDLRPGEPEPGDHPARSGERVEGRERHRGRGRGAGRDLHDAGRELDACSVRRGEVRERGQRVGAVGLRGPHRVVTEALRELHACDGELDVGARPRVESKSEQHGRTLRHAVAIEPGRQQDARGRR